jgi:DNA-binding transcriptional LysR family regulator
MAATGQVIAFMPALTVIHELATGRLRAIPVPDFTTARSGVVVHRDRPLSHAAQTFLKVLVASIQGLSEKPPL